MLQTILSVNNTRLALEKCKQDLEALYEDKEE